VTEDDEKKLPTSEELPTSDSGDENEKEAEGKPETVIVDRGDVIVVHHRLPDGTLDNGCEFFDYELIPDEDEDYAHLDEDVQKAWRKARTIKTVDVETIEAVKDILDCYDKPIFTPETPGTDSPATPGEPRLSFTKPDLDAYAAQRKERLAKKSQQWIDTDAAELWESTKGVVSQPTPKELRQNVLKKYESADSHSKVLSFAKSFLKFLTTTKAEPRYQTFAPYLELPKTVKERKNVTSRIVTKDDINNVLQHIAKAEREGDNSPERSAQYSALVLFGAYTGQRSEATIAKLTVGQFRDAISVDKPVLLVDASQDKVRMSHYVPLAPRVVEALKPLLVGRDDDELMFTHSSFLQWIKRQKIPMTRFQKPFVLGDLRKFSEQYGDIIQWNQSNRAYILTHGVSGVEWEHYRSPLPEYVYEVYMQYWKDVELSIS